MEMLGTLFESMDDMISEMMWGSIPFKKTTVSYPMRFGWYYRRSTKNNEFWWGGVAPLVVVSDEYVMTMPEEIINEIGNALNAKAEGAYLD